MHHSSIKQQSVAKKEPQRCQHLIAVHESKKIFYLCHIVDTQAAPLLAIFNISYHIAYNILFTILLFMYITILGGAIGWWRIYLRRNSLHTDGQMDGWTDDSLIFSSIGLETVVL